MYNPLLDTFLTTADCGSFSKAAKQLYISPTAVMKRMNSLETHLNLSLFERSPGGVKLTDAGRIIYDGALAIKKLSQETLSKAQSAAGSDQSFFNVGTSLLNPAKPFMDLWNRVSDQFPGYKLRLLPFEDDHNGILAQIRRLDEDFDFLVGVCDSKQWFEHCQILELGRYRKMVAVAPGHRLAGRRKISLEDLYGETLMMVPEGDSQANDQIRHDLIEHHPQIHIEDTSQFFDLSVFNRCAATDRVLLIVECWQNVHPGLIPIEVDWDYSIPYGLLYSRHPSEKVRRFVEALK